jgi:hypothetical protein
MKQGGVLGLPFAVASGGVRRKGVEKPVKISEKKWLDEGQGVPGGAGTAKADRGRPPNLFRAILAAGQTGLSTWFERKGLQHGRVVDAMKPFIKVKVALPLDKKEAAAV